MSIDFEAAFRRIDAIIGDEDDPSKGAEIWLDHLRTHLALPCDVTGEEDFVGKSRTSLVSAIRENTVDYVETSRRTVMCSFLKASNQTPPTVNGRCIPMTSALE